MRIGERKIIFTLIPQFNNTSIRELDINLICSNSKVEIEETEKINQYSIYVNETDSMFVALERWVDIGNRVVLLKKYSKWLNIKEVYKVINDKILLDTIRLKLTK